MQKRPVRSLLSRIQRWWLVQLEPLVSRVRNIQALFPLENGYVLVFVLEDCRAETEAEQFSRIYHWLQEGYTPFVVYIQCEMPTPMSLLGAEQLAELDLYYIPGQCAGKTQPGFCQFCPSVRQTYPLNHLVPSSNNNEK